MDKQELLLEFSHDSRERSDLLEDARRQLIEFVGTDIAQWNMFLMFVSEMIKNIIDHADRKGRAQLIKDPNTITFAIKDYGVQSYDFEALRNNSSKSGNKINFGIGLDTIPQLAELLGIDLLINTSRGFSYSGTWNYKTKST